MLIDRADVFETEPPSDQALVDIFAGQWKTAFPAEMGLEAGTEPYFDDTRIPWAGARIGGLAGKNVLELGPFEAYNTVHICREQPARVVAIEANRMNFMKCLIVKELFSIDASFRLGDFVGYLESTDETFDICYASGVLYHQTEPLRFLEAVARVAPAVFVWTHYYDDEALRGSKNWKHFEHGEPIVQERGGFRAELHPRSYLFGDEDKRPQKFSGGFEPYAYWMRYDDIIGHLTHLGMGDIEIRHRGETGAGPTVSLIAKR